MTIAIYTHMTRTATKLVAVPTCRSAIVFAELPASPFALASRCVR
jgi:hypothetical protein